MKAKVIAKNKKAYFDYEIVEKYETGIILKGPEVKSIKGGHIQLKGSFALVKDGRVLIENMHVSPYKYAPKTGYDPLRIRELLLHKKEIAHLAGQSSQKGFTLIPLEILLKNGFIKIVLGVCRGKKKHDKRDTLKKRAIMRDISRDVKEFSR